MNLFVTAGAAYSPAGLTGYGAGANLAGGLADQATSNGITPRQPIGGYGPVLGAIYQRGVASGSKGPLASVDTLLTSAFAISGGDSAIAKNYFANGAANNSSTYVPGAIPVPAVAPTGYSLPTYNGLPNTTNSVYDLAYGVTNRQGGQNPYGSSRPYQVAPSRITIYNPLATIGVDTNSSFPSGHTAYGFTYGTLLAMLVPQQYQSMLLRASEYGESRSVLGVHYVLDVIGGRVQSYYDLAQAFTNPAYIDNAAVTGTAINLPTQFVKAQTQLQAYLAAQCGNTVAACAGSAANAASNPYVPSAANQAAYQSRLTYG
ncbi:phosphatase PAP2 family protein, partial [Methylobacterium sp. J-088]|uniref:phosphatase PAP2 family protein n=1 Tax=Methylobacterium sp. J-088 TaxID=2836664 RepID=UPI001FB99483